MSSMVSSPVSPGPDSRQSSLVIRDRSNAPDGSSKRKRTLTKGAGRASSRRRTREPDGDEDGVEEEDFDPDQSIEERRTLQRGYRDLIRDLHDNNDEYLKDDSTGLHDTLRKANQLLSGVKQTTEAAIDSRLLVSTADASYRKTLRLTSGNIAQGVDVDEFVSKCITYMRLGSGIAEDDAPELTSTQQRRRNPGVAFGGGGDDDDDMDDEGDMFNWEHLGRFACLPKIRRPATPGFLLGPLSAEVKKRKIVKRSAPFRHNNLPETRPEVLDPEAVQRNEKNDLTAICSKILQRLKQVQSEAQDAVEEAMTHGADEEEAHRLMARIGLRDTGGIDLLRFVVNPHSFGQTVENMFYVSFLIRDGRIRVDFDANKLPTLGPVDREDETATAKHRAQKQQAVFSLDMKTWRDIIDAFSITEPIIEHRKEQDHQGPGARGWYN